MAVPLSWQGLPDQYQDAVKTILQQGEASWLRNPQVAYLLALGIGGGVLPVNQAPDVPIQQPHAEAPQIGSLFLFRDNVRFRNDLLPWRPREGSNQHPIVVGEVERLRLYYATPPDGRRGLRRRHTYWLLGAGKEHIRLVHYGSKEWADRDPEPGPPELIPPTPQLPATAPVRLVRPSQWPTGKWELEVLPQAEEPQQAQRQAQQQQQAQQQAQQAQQQAQRQGVEYQQQDGGTQDDMDAEPSLPEDAGLLSPPSPKPLLSGLEQGATTAPVGQQQVVGASLVAGVEGGTPAVELLRRPGDTPQPVVLGPVFDDSLDEMEDWESFVESALWMGQPIPAHVQQLSDEALDEFMLDAQDELLEGLVEDSQLPVPLGIQAVSPGQDTLAGGAAVSIAVVRQGPFSEAALALLQASFGGVEVSAMMLEPPDSLGGGGPGTVICTAPPREQPGIVPLFLTLGGGQPVSTHTFFQYVGPGGAAAHHLHHPVPPPTPALPLLPPAQQQQHAGGSRGGAGSGPATAPRGLLVGGQRGQGQQQQWQQQHEWKQQHQHEWKHQQQHEWKHQQQHEWKQQQHEWKQQQQPHWQGSSIVLSLESEPEHVYGDERECQAAVEAGRAAMREQRYDDAYDQFSTAVELGQSSAAKFQGALGRCAAAVKLGRVQQAAAEARLAQQLAPDNPCSAVADGLAHMADSNIAPALRCLKRCRAANPTYPDIAGIDRLAQAAIEGSRRRLGLTAIATVSSGAGKAAEQEAPLQVKAAVAAATHAVSFSSGVQRPSEPQFMAGFPPTKKPPPVRVTTPTTMPMRGLKRGLSMLKEAAGGLLGGACRGGSPNPSRTDSEGSKRMGSFRKLMRRLSSAFSTGGGGSNRKSGNSSPQTSSGLSKTGSIGTAAVETPSTPTRGDSFRGLRRMISG